MKWHSFLMSILIIVSVMMVGSSVWAQDEKPEEPKLNLNLATLDELLELPDITEEMAQAIFDNRPYESFLNVLELEGITEEFLVSIEEIAEAKALNINSASVAELKLLPGITVELAEAIVKARQVEVNTKGRQYEIVEELLQIKGINQEMLDNLKGFIKAVPSDDEETGDKGWKLRLKNQP